ncbi:MAG: hypothetical protein AAFX44_10705 [Pseudomonadota bacterium]
MTLPAVLRIVAALIAVMVLGEYVVLGALMIPPLIVIALLVAISFAAKLWPFASAFAAMTISVLAPIAAINGYLQGAIPLIVPIFDLVIFSWLLWTALRTVRSVKAQHA